MLKREHTTIVETVKPKRKRGKQMNEPRNNYTYHFILGDRIIHGGITIDPERREREHQLDWPGGYLQIIGGPMSESEARAWEKINGYT